MTKKAEFSGSSFEGKEIPGNPDFGPGEADLSNHENANLDLDALDQLVEKDFVSYDAKAKAAAAPKAEEDAAAQDDPAPEQPPAKKTATRAESIKVEGAAGGDAPDPAAAPAADVTEPQADDPVAALRTEFEQARAEDAAKYARLEAHASRLASQLGEARRTPPAERRATRDEELDPEDESAGSTALREVRELRKRGDARESEEAAAAEVSAVTSEVMGLLKTAGEGASPLDGESILKSVAARHAADFAEARSESNPDVARKLGRAVALAMKADVIGEIAKARRAKAQAAKEQMGKDSIERRKAASSPAAAAASAAGPQKGATGNGIDPWTADMKELDRIVARDTGTEATA